MSRQHEIFYEIYIDCHILFLKIEREKADLSVQVITLSERLDEAEGGAENQVNDDFIPSIINLKSIKTSIFVLV